MDIGKGGLSCDRGLRPLIEKGRHPRRIMAAFEERFGEGPEVEFLRILGLFDRPAEQGAIEALRRNEAFIVHKLGAVGAALSSVSYFFEVPCHATVAGLNDASKACMDGIGK